MSEKIINWIVIPFMVVAIFATGLAIGTINNATQYGKPETFPAHVYNFSSGKWGEVSVRYSRQGKMYERKFIVETMWCTKVTNHPVMLTITPKWNPITKSKSESISMENVCIQSQ